MKHLQINNPEFNFLLGDYDRFIVTKGYGNGKPVYYQSNVQEFLHFISQNGITNICSVNVRHVIEYYEYLKQRKKQKRNGFVSISMVAHQLFSLRLFFDFLLDSGVIENSPVRLSKFYITEYNQRDICTVNEVKKIYAACETFKERSIVSTAYGCGLRRSEIHGLNIIDVILSKSILIVRTGKNSKSRTVPLSEKVIEDFKGYILNERGQNYQDPSFILDDQNKRMSGHNLNEIIKALCIKTQKKSLKKKNITLHSLRHSIATHLLDNGANIEFIQQFLGHACIDTSHLYAIRRKQNGSRKQLK